LKEIKINTYVKKAQAGAIILATVGLVAGCGGGGGGGETATPAVTASNVTMQLAPSTISIKDAEALATTELTTVAKTASLTITDVVNHPVKAMRLALESIFPTAHAYDGQTQLVTRKMIGAVLSSLNTQFKYTKIKLGQDGKPVMGADGKPVVTTDVTNCPLPNDTEVLITESKELLPDVFLVQMSYPEVMAPNCAIQSYANKKFIVDSKDRLYSLEDTVKDVRKAVGTSDIAYNASNSAFLQGTDQSIWKVDADTNGKIELKKLAIEHAREGDQPDMFKSLDMPVSFLNELGSFAFDGDNLITTISVGGITSQLESGVAMLNLASGKITSIVAPNMNGAGSFYMDGDKDFILGSANGRLLKVNKETGEREAKWNEPAFKTNGNKGRFGNIVMSNNCLLTNLETGEVNTMYSGQLVPVAGPSNLGVYPEQPAADKSFLKGNYAYCVDKEKTRFMRMDLRNNNIVTFHMKDVAPGSLSNPYPVRGYSMAGDTLLLQVAEPVVIHESRFLTNDFKTGVTVDLGVNTNHSRKISQLLSLGR